MGNVNFNTLVAKTVDIDKVVNLDVNKDVFAFVDVQGNLATAEASADAIGVGGSTPGEPGSIFTFWIDDFDEDQAVTDTFGLGNDGESSTAELPSPYNMDAGDTDIPGDPAADPLVAPNAIRTLFIETLGQEPPDVEEASGSVNTTTPQNVLNFEFGADAFGNSWAQYTSSVGAFDVTGPDITNADIDGEDVLLIDLNEFNAGNAPAGSGDATLRFSVIFEDANNDIAIGSSVLFGDITEEVTIPVQLQTFLDETLASPPGTQFDPTVPIALIGVEDDADGNGVSGVDFDNITSITLVLEDQPGQTDGLPGGIQTTNADYGSLADPDNGIAGEFVFNSFVPEVASESGTDLSLDNLRIISQQPPVPGEGFLAETDTFAQVGPEGAFSFSEALAASSTVFDDIG